MSVTPDRPVPPDEPAVSDLDVSRFRRAMGRFATGVTVVATRIGSTDHAMTASAFTSVSLEPMLVLICVEQDARFHDAIEQAGVWSVSILDEGSRATSQWLATRGRPLHDQLDQVPHHLGAFTGTPVLDHALAALECRTTAMYPAGDHSIVVGQVLGVELPDSPAGALIYHRGSYTRLP